VQQLAKAGKLPRTMVAYANSVRELGNVGIHGAGEAITEEDVVSSLENLMRLVAWYCEQVRPGGEGKIEPEPPPIKDGNIAERERADKERAEKERAEKERAEKERAEKERADKERVEKERLEKEKEKQQKKPPGPSRKPIVVVLLAACVLGGALWWWLEASPAARHKEFLKHKYDGIALLKSGNYADARLELLSAYSFDSNDDYVYFCLGEAEYHLGNLRYAIDYYQRSLKLKPDANYAQIGLANALLQSGDVDGAIAEDKAILSASYSFPLDPAALAQVHTNYGQALLRKGDINGSSEQFGLAVKANPGWRSQLGDRIKVSPQTH
jgi:tetratricopeptide (TPR) repeat protein